MLQTCSCTTYNTISAARHVHGADDNLGRVCSAYLLIYMEDEQPIDKHAQTAGTTPATGLARQRAVEAQLNVATSPADIVKVLTETGAATSGLSRHTLNTLLYAVERCTRSGSWAAGDAALKPRQLIKTVLQHNLPAALQASSSPEKVWKLVKRLTPLAKPPFRLVLSPGVQTALHELSSSQAFLTQLSSAPDADVTGLVTAWSRANAAGLACGSMPAALLHVVEQRTSRTAPSQAASIQEHLQQIKATAGSRPTSSGRQAAHREMPSPTPQAAPASVTKSQAAAAAVEKGTSKQGSAYSSRMKPASTAAQDPARSSSSAPDSARDRLQGVLDDGVQDAGQLSGACSALVDSILSTPDTALDDMQWLLSATQGKGNAAEAAANEAVLQVLRRMGVRSMDLALDTACNLLLPDGHNEDSLVAPAALVQDVVAAFKLRVIPQLQSPTRTPSMVLQLTPPLSPHKLAQLMRLNASLEAPERTPQDERVVFATCASTYHSQKLTHEMAQLDGPTLIDAWGALIQSGHQAPVVQGQLYKRAGDLLRSMQADQLAESARRQAAVITQLRGSQRQGDALQLLRITVRSAWEHRSALSGAGLTRLLCAVAELPREQAGDVEWVLPQLLPQLAASAADLQPDQVEQVVWALSELQQYHAPLLDALCDRTCDHAPRMRMSGIITVLKACALLGHESAAMTRAFEVGCKAASYRMHSCRIGNIVNLALACAVADQDPQVSPRPSSRGGGDPNSSRAAPMSQLLLDTLAARQKELASASRAVKGAMNFTLRIWAVLKPQLKVGEGVRRAAQVVPSSTRSDTQRAVAALLRSRKLLKEVKEEFDVGCGWVVDVVGVMTAADGTRVRVAIETDGPAHFAQNLPSHVMGSTRIRNKCICACGYRLLAVPLQGQDALPQASGAAGNKEAVAYLKTRLAAIV